MDVVFVQAVNRITDLPQQTQREIGVALLAKASQLDLPVIEFSAHADETVG